MAQKAHSAPEVSNLGHPPDLMQSQTHLIVTLCLLKPWRQHRPLHEPLQEEEEMKIPPQTLVVKSKTLSTSETPLISLLDEPLDPLMDLVDLVVLEVLED
jgi:hypothetical protein